jgi:hypothetical protein
VSGAGLGESMIRLLGILRQHNGLTTGEIARALGVTMDEAVFITQEGMRRRLIRPFCLSEWCVTDYGDALFLEESVAA